MFRDDTGWKTQSLPFVVKMASRSEIALAARVRAEAYGRHLPELGARLIQPETADFEYGCAVLAAVSKLDGSVLGSLRIHTNAVTPLPLEASVKLPARFVGPRLAEATRLSIGRSPDSSTVRSALFKAFFHYTLIQEIDWMVVAGRSPVDRIYDGLLFRDVLHAKAYYPMAHAAGVPHRVMSFEPATARALWKKEKHPLYGFVFEMFHVDIDLEAAPKLAFAQTAETGDEYAVRWHYQNRDLIPSRMIA